MIAPEVTPEVSHLLAAVSAQERFVLGLLFAHPEIAAPIADAAGLTIHHFADDDHRVLYAGWELVRDGDCDRITALRIASLELRRMSLWDDAVPAGSTGMLHSFRTLARLATGPMLEEDIADACGQGPEDGLRRGIARHVVALVDVAIELEGR